MPENSERTFKVTFSWSDGFKKSFNIKTDMWWVAVVEKAWLQFLTLPDSETGQKVHFNSPPSDIPPDISVEEVFPDGIIQEFDRLTQVFVPESGLCKTLQGELLRAVGRIRYDYFNNGFANNWSGAYNFLDTYMGMSLSVKHQLFRYRTGEYECKERGYTVFSYGDNDPIVIALQTLVESVVSKVLFDNHNHRLVDNPCDMFTLQEKS
jgi:hypothetical protein